jgi:hypothetical protein
MWEGRHRIEKDKQKKEMWNGMRGNGGAEEMVRGRRKRAARDKSSKKGCHTTRSRKHGSRETG